MTGDRYGFLFFVFKEGDENNSMVFHRDIDRLYYKTVPIGTFANYFSESPNTSKNNRLNLTSEKPVFDFLETYPEIELLEFVSDEIMEVETNKTEDDLRTTIDFEIVDEGTKVSILHELNIGNDTYSYTVNYVDPDKLHQYSYENNLSYNHFSLMQYYLIESLQRLQEIEELDTEKLNDILRHKSITEILKQGMNHDY